MQVIPYFHNYIDTLPERLRERIKSQAITRHIGKSEQLYPMGSSSKEIYQVISGCVRLSNFSVEGKEMVMGSFLPGDCFGEIGVIDGSPRMSCAFATEKSAVLVISGALFKDLYQNEPDFLREINRVLCLRTRLLYGMVEDANILNLRERLARALLRLAYGSDQNPHSQEKLTITASQEELGCLLGASRQSINKELKQLCDEGLIELSYGKIRINDLDSIRDAYEDILGPGQISPAYNKET